MKKIILVLLMLLLLAGTASAEIKMLFHFDETAGTQLMTDETGNHELSCSNGAATAAFYAKWGNALDLTGATYYGEIADSADFDMFLTTSGAYTVDCWIRNSSNLAAGSEVYISHNLSSSTVSRLNFVRSQFEALGIGCTYNDVPQFEAWSLTALTGANLSHYAWIRVGNELGVYLNGGQVAYTTVTSGVDIDGLLYLGRAFSGSYCYAGMDELRIDDDNPFGAAPNSSKTDTITVPTAPYELPSEPQDPPENVSQVIVVEMM